MTLAVFLFSLTDLVLCLLALSDLVRAHLKKPALVATWFAICILIPIFGPMSYLLLRGRFRDF